MNLPLVKKELLQQPGAAIDVSEDYFGLSNPLNSDGNAKTQLGAALGHPLQPLEDSRYLESVRQELALAKRMCGSQMSHQLAMELQSCAHIGRLQCPSSRCMIDTLLGLDDTVTLDDVLKNPDNLEHIPDMSIMSQMKK